MHGYMYTVHGLATYHGGGEHDAWLRYLAHHSPTFDIIILLPTLRHLYTLFKTAFFSALLHVVPYLIPLPPTPHLTTHAPRPGPVEPSSPRLHTSLAARPLLISTGCTKAFGTAGHVSGYF